MKFTIWTKWTAKRVTIKEILGTPEYRYAMFIEDFYDNPWKYNGDWFESQNPSKMVFVLTEPEEDSKMEM